MNLSTPKLGVDVATEPVEPELDAAQGGGFQEVLGRGPFRLVWFAQLASQLADKFLMFSLIILAYRLSHGSTVVAITLLSYTFPAVAIAPIAGVLADRYDRKFVMYSTNFARGVLIAGIPLAALVPGLRDEFVHLLLITIAFSAVGQLFSPAESAVIPTLVPKRSLISANSLVMLTMVLTLVGGGALAPLASRVDIYAPYWIATVLYAFAGALILLADIPRLAVKKGWEDRHPFHAVLVEMKEGMDALRRSPVLMATFLQLSLALLVMFMMFTLAPAYVNQVIGIGEQDSYIILVPATTGAIASALLLGQIGRRWNKAGMLITGLVTTGLTLILLAAVPNLMRDFAGLREQTRGFGAAFSFVLGLEFGTLMIPSLTYLMEHTADDVRGRIFSLLYMVINGVTAVPVLVAAALSDTLGINHVIGALGALLALTGVAVAGLARRVFAAEPA
jgi:MFS family permease